MIALGHRLRSYVHQCQLELRVQGGHSNAINGTWNGLMLSQEDIQVDVYIDYTTYISN